MQLSQVRIKAAHLHSNPERLKSLPHSFKADCLRSLLKPSHCDQVQSDHKVLRQGTHRCCTAEQTWQRLQPLLPQAGITRVADITQLDSVGLPVFQAVRPHSRALAVSQGKGLTPLLAKVSAVMESLESWSAEQIPVAVTRQRASDLGLAYDPSQLARHGYGQLARQIRLDWATAVDLHRGDATYVPHAFVALDWSVGHNWAVEPFLATSNGLASGNSRNEALVHAINELVERFTMAKPAGQPQPIDPATLPGGSSRIMVELIQSGGHRLSLLWWPSAIGLPVFSATLHCEQLPQLFGGYGAHLDADVALSRAISEAAQSRLTRIAGARDDLCPWNAINTAQSGTTTPTASEHISLEAVQEKAEQAGLRPGSTLNDDLNSLLGALEPYTLLALDLTPLEGIHVLRVVSPELDTLSPS